MATTQYATFELDGHLFAVEVNRVQEVLKTQPSTPVPLAAGSVGGLINLRGQVVTAIDVRHRLELPPRPADADAMNVVVRVDGEVISLLVDVIGDVIDVDEDTFEHPPDTVTGSGRQLVRGAYKLTDRLLLALDVDRVCDV